MVDATGKYIGPPIPTTSPGAPIMTVPQGRFPGDSTPHSNLPGLSAPRHATGGLIGYFSTGGPSGSDTIPAWLSPGEFVMNADATKNTLPWLQMWNAGHYDEGTPDPLQAQPAGTMPPPKNAGPGKPSGIQNPLMVSAPIAPPPPPEGAPAASMPGTQPSSDIHQLPGLATPGGDSQQPGEGLPASPGIGFSGGIIGAAEGAASGGADLFAPGSGAAMQIGFQEINRAASAMAQYAGIGVEGLLEAAIPSSGGTGGDWAKTIPGRLLMGVTGVRPNGANTAGNTQTAAPPSSAPGTQIGTQINGDVHAHGVNDASAFEEWSQQQSQMAGAAYPSAGGR
jgi:hypothetical protein